MGVEVLLLNICAKTPPLRQSPYRLLLYKGPLRTQQSSLNLIQYNLPGSHIEPKGWQITASPCENEVIALSKTSNNDPFLSVVEHLRKKKQRNHRHCASFWRNVRRR